VILLDIKLPHIDSLELARLHDTSGVPSEIVVVAGFIAPRIRLRFSELGVRGFVQKPFPLTCLVDTVRTALDRSEDEPFVIGPRIA